MAAQDVETDVLSRLGRVARAVRTVDGRQLRHYARRMGFRADGAAALWVIRTLKLIASPFEFVERRLAMRRVARNPAFARVLDERTGWGVLPPAALPGVERVIASAQRILREYQDGTRDWGWQKKEFRKVIFGPEDLQAFPEVRDLILSEPVLQIASDYLGTVPILESVQIWWTPVNGNLESSQLFHRDGIDFRQVKFLVNLNDVGPDSGPFCFLPADISARLSGLIRNWRTRVDDEDIFRHAQPSDVVAATGPAGSGYVVDSCRCFHYGSRARGGERLLLMFNFASYLCPLDAVMSAHLDATPFRDDPVRRLVLKRA